MNETRGLLQKIPFSLAGLYRRRHVSSRVTVISIFLLALILYLQGLSKGIWLDEYDSIRVAFSQEFWAALRGYDHPPFYFMLLRGWGSCFREEAFLRLFSVLLSMGTLVVMLCWLWRCSQRAACLAGVLFITLPLLLRYSQEIRHYALLLLLTGLSYLWADCAAARPGEKRYYLAWSVTLSCAVWVHLLSVFLVLPSLLYHLTRLETRLRWPECLKAGLSCLAPGVFFLFLYGFFLAGAQKGYSWWMPPLSMKLLSEIAAKVFGVEACINGIVQSQASMPWAVPGLRVIFLAGGGGLGLAVLLGDWRINYPFMVAACVYWGELLLFSWFHTPILWDRTALPGLLPMVAFVALQLDSLQRPLLRRFAMGATYGIVLFFALFWMLYQSAQPREHWRSIAGMLENHHQGEDTVFFYPAYAQGPVSYYFPEMEANELTVRLSATALEEGLTPFHSRLQGEESVYFMLRNDLEAKKHQAEITIFLNGLARIHPGPAYQFSRDDLHLWIFSPRIPIYKEASSEE